MFHIPILKLYKLLSALTYRQQSSRTTIVVCLILLIGLKVIAPVFKVTRGFVKELITAAEPDTQKTEKGTDTDDYAKSKEYNVTPTNTLDGQRWYTKVICRSEYSIDYKSSYYYKITIPPPEFSLHTLV